MSIRLLDVSENGIPGIPEISMATKKNMMKLVADLEIPEKIRDGSFYTNSTLKPSTKSMDWFKGKS